MKVRLPCVAVALALLLPAAASAQDRDADVVRRVYAFLGDRLTVRIETELPGTIRLIRGEKGRLEVAGRAPDGIPGFGLAERSGGELQLTAIGADRVEYLVVVPEEVHVKVRLPDRPVAEVFGAYDRTATFRWE
ncbi:MAG TPA: hypothetical protein VF212_12305 [Longimicrobiales bacterium]